MRQALKFLILLSVFGSLNSEAQTLKKTLAKYAAAENLQFDIKKTDEKPSLGTHTEANGILKYYQGQIYILQNGEKKTELFYSKDTLTLVEYPDPDFGSDGKRTVTIVRKKTPMLVTSLINLFSSQKKFFKDFTVLKEKLTDNGNTYTAELKTKEKSVKDIKLVINKKTLEIVSLSFVDDVETRTTLNFSNVKLNQKIKNSDFNFIEQKSDEVITQ